MALKILINSKCDIFNKRNKFIDKMPKIPITSKINPPMRSLVVDSNNNCKEKNQHEMNTKRVISHSPISKEKFSIFTINRNFDNNENSQTPFKAIERNKNSSGKKNLIKIKFTKFILQSDINTAEEEGEVEKKGELKLKQSKSEVKQKFNLNNLKLLKKHKMGISEKIRDKHIKLNQKKIYVKGFSKSKLGRNIRNNDILYSSNSIRNLNFPLTDKRAKNLHFNYVLSPKSSKNERNINRFETISKVADDYNDSFINELNDLFNQVNKEDKKDDIEKNGPNINNVNINSKNTIENNTIYNRPTTSYGDILVKKYKLKDSLRNKSAKIDF